MIFKGKVTERKTGAALSGVSVSDGKNICLTDKDGNFCFSGWDKANVINLGILTKNHSDWYIYIKGHEGDFDFCVDTVNCDGDFSYFHTSDTEIEYTDIVEWTAFCKDKVKEHRPAFFMHTGDLCRDAVMRHYLVMNRETTGCPVRYAIGNHDYIGKSYGEEMYERLYGPTRYSFDCGGMHFIVLPMAYGDNPSCYSALDTAEWLENDLELCKGKKITVLTHDACDNDKDGFMLDLGSRVFDMRKKGLAAWVFGHYHFNLLRNDNGVLNISTSRPDSGGIDSSPAAIRKISVSEKDGVSSQMLYNIPDGASEKTQAVWSASFDGNIEFSSPVVACGSVFVGISCDGFPRSCGIAAINAGSGKTEWFYETQNSVKSSPVYDDKRIYAQDLDGNLLCLDAENGKLIWQNRPEKVFLGTRTGICVTDDAVVCVRRGEVFAFEKKNGKSLWHTDLRGGESSPAGIVFDKKRNQFIVSIHWKYLAALDATSGEVKWTSGKGHMWYRTSTPLLCEDTIVVTGMTTAFRLSAEDGSVIYSKDIVVRADVAGAPAICENTVYLPTANCGVVALDAKTFEEKKKFSAGKARLFTSPYISGNFETCEGSVQMCDNMIVFPSSDGCIYFYNEDTAELVKKIVVGSPVISTPVIADGYIITASFDGRVSKYKV